MVHFEVNKYTFHGIKPTQTYSPQQHKDRQLCMPIDCTFVVTTIFLGSLGFDPHSSPLCVNASAGRPLTVFRFRHFCPENDSFALLPVMCHAQEQFLSGPGDLFMFALYK